MSPEQCQGKQTDQRCDIYSLGATFYCMITGKRPFTGASVMEIMQKHIDEEPISPREYNTEIAVQIVEVPSGVEPLGARPVGEPPAVPGPAAVVNAVASATGVRIRQLPIAADQLLA